MIKYLLFAGALAVVASPSLPETDPYAKYDLLIDHAQVNIEKTKSAIDEMRVINEERIQEVAVQMDSVKQIAEEMTEQIQIVNRVFNSLKVEMPASMDEWYEDSLRIENMNRLNEIKSEKID